MGLLSRRVFSRRLCRLDDAELAIFVGDIYAARGADVEVDGNEVLVEPGPRTGASTRIRYFSPSRFESIVGNRMSISEGTDIVVTTRKLAPPARGRTTVSDTSVPMNSVKCCCTRLIGIPPRRCADATSVHR